MKRMVVEVSNFRFQVIEIADFSRHCKGQKILHLTINGNIGILE